ncbi:hypothetical protein [Pseudomonas cichorii]|uniref:hypothetical protein n=1 Tax=Pseudomonas cichorii TaxID=36746 RepID=UPI001C8AB9B3|nr:hypothetical protein [Pseudomonas cichorii]MBX8530318.1 hypothetical protein [Pseudomonas cichorii]MBX8576563.1 hypothetical protein [Pseudomonas cichorii]
MEVKTKTAAPQTAYKPAALEKMPEPRSSRFAQIFSDVKKTAQGPGTAIIPSAATLTRLVQPRSTYFLQNMSPEQRKSAVNDKDFEPRPAALERVASQQSRQLKHDAV